VRQESFEYLKSQTAVQANSNRPTSPPFSWLGSSAQPFRISCHMLSISTNYVIAEAPASRLAPASNAACAFSVTIRSASRRADLPPTISFIILSAITVFASTANIIKGVNCRRLIAEP
jgi:hypothetical protein